VHSTHRPLAASQTGSAALRFAQPSAGAPIAPHPTQTLFEQTGFAGSEHWALVEHSTHRPLVISHTGAAADRFMHPSAGALIAPHETHWLLTQRGAPACEQSAEPLHWTQRPLVASHTAAAGLRFAHPSEGTPLAAHAEQRPPAQIGLASGHSLLSAHSGQRPDGSAVAPGVLHGTQAPPMQTGASERHVPLATHSAHRPEVASHIGLLGSRPRHAFAGASAHGTHMLFTQKGASACLQSDGPEHWTVQRPAAGLHTGAAGLFTRQASAGAAWQGTQTLATQTGAPGSTQSTDVTHGTGPASEALAPGASTPAPASRGRQSAVARSQRFDAHSSSARQVSGLSL
jgi:hypothetical protein